MIASMSTIRGDDPDLDTAARLAGETMVPWLREFAGYRGLLVLTDKERGTARFITFWESEEAAERSRPGRLRMRDQMAAGAGVEVESTEAYAVALLDGL